MLNEIKNMLESVESRNIYFSESQLNKPEMAKISDKNNRTKNLF